jgi:hypothetical protein
MKVYVVTSGDMCERKLEAVCSTEEIAKGAKVLFETHNPIEVWEIDDLSAKPIISRYWRINMKKDGHIGYISNDGPAIDEPHPKNYLYDGTMFFNVKADSREQAIQVADEERLYLIAHKEWR